MKKRVIIITAVLILAVSFASSILIYANNDTVKIKKQLDLGQKYLTELDYEQAIVCYTKVLDINENSTEAYMGLGSAYYALGNYESTMEALKNAYNVTKDQILLEEICGLYLDMGLRLMDCSEYSTAIELFEDAYELYPDSADIVINLAKSYKENNELSKAVKLLKEATERFNNQEMDDLYSTYVELSRPQPWFSTPLITTKSILVNGKGIDELSIEGLLDEYDLVKCSKTTYNDGYWYDYYPRSIVSIPPIYATTTSGAGEYITETYYWEEYIYGLVQAKLSDDKMLSMDVFDLIMHECLWLSFEDEYTYLSLENGDQISNWYSMEGSVSAYGDTCQNILEKLPVEYSSMIQDIKIGEKKIYFYGEENLRGKIEYKKDATGMGTFLDIHQGVLKISWHFDGLSDGKLDYILVYYGDDVKTWQ